MKISNTVLCISTLLYSCAKSGSTAVVTSDTTTKSKPIIVDSTTVTIGDTTKTLMTTGSFKVLRHPPDTANIVVEYRLYYTRTNSGDMLCETSMVCDSDHDGFNASLKIHSEPNYDLYYVLFQTPGTTILKDFHGLDMVPNTMTVISSGN